MENSLRGFELFFHGFLSSRIRSDIGHDLGKGGPVSMVKSAFNLLPGSRKPQIADHENSESHSLRIVNWRNIPITLIFAEWVHRCD